MKGGLCESICPRTPKAWTKYRNKRAFQQETGEVVEERKELYNTYTVAH